MPNLFLMRHGKAEPNSVSGKDIDRPLSEKGLQSSSKTSEFFKSIGLNPTIAMCSEAVRTRQTLQFASSDQWSPEETHFFKELYLASSDSIAECFAFSVVQNHWLQNDIIIIGHNPGLSQLAFHWMGSSTPSDWQGMKVGSILHFEYAEPVWPDILADPPSFSRKMEFRNYWTPKMIFSILGKE